MLLAFSSILFSQKTIRVFVADTLEKPKHNFVFSKEDSTKIQKKIKFLVDSLSESGYLSPKINYNSNDSSIVILPGNRYKWAKIYFDNEIDALMLSAGVDLKDWRGKYISQGKVAILSEKILNYLENSGYPFAYVKMDSIQFETEDSINAKLVINKNKKIYFDSIAVTTGIDLSSKYLEKYLDIRKGDIFDKSKVDKSTGKLGNLPFVILNSPPTVSFFGSGATLNLDLKEKKVNRFDFILGLLPDNTGVRKYKLTGEITAEFLNKLGHGERFFFNYKNMAKGRQNLKLNINYPYVLDLPYGLDSRFDIFINEDQYRDVNFDFGVQYLFKGVNFVKTYWKLFSSRLLKIDSSTILALGRLPDKLDIVSNGAGLQFSFDNLDYRFNPSRGFDILLDGNGGQRKILKNQQIIKLKDASTDFSYSYDSLNQAVYIFDVSAKMAYYHPLGKKIVFKVANRSAWKKTGKKLYQNELYRLGGNKLLRGFDEESILASIYSVSTAEVRLLIDKNSFIFAFMDYAYVYNPFSNVSKEDTPLGFGAGINFDTKGGILSLTAAVGKQYSNPVNYKDVKIHIGYVSLF